MKLMTSLLACGLLAASAGVQAADGSALNEILESGVLKVGTTGDWNPMTMKDPATNSYRGYDIDIMTALAEDLGVKVEFVPTDWKTLVNGLVAGKYHVTGSASLSPKRAKVAGYSTPYFEVATVPLTLKKNAERFESWEDINQAGVSVAATLGTTQEQQVKLYFPNAEHRIIEAPARDFQEVVAGRADAHITSNVEAGTLVQKFPELMVVPVDAPRSRTPVAMLLPQRDQVWINYVNHWIQLKEAAGFFDEIGRKWGLVLN